MFATHAPGRVCLEYCGKYCGRPKSWTVARAYVANIAIPPDPIVHGCKAAKPLDAERLQIVLNRLLPLQAGSIVQMLRLQLLPPLAMSAIICLALGPACAGVMLLCGLAHLPGSQVSLA